MNELYHYGVLGMKWGIRRYQKYGEGGYTPKNKVVFVSGSSKTQDRNSEYYRKRLPKEVRKEINKHIKSKDRFVVGDAPGIDSQVQDYLKKKHYKNVDVFTGDKEVRKLSDKNWKTLNMHDPKLSEEQNRARKDIFMSNIADVGIAVVIENGGASKTRDNLKRLDLMNKPVKVAELKANKGYKWLDKRTLVGSFDENQNFTKTGEIQIWKDKKH